MPSWMEGLQSTVRNGRRTSMNSCSREVGRRSSSHDFGGDYYQRATCLCFTNCLKLILFTMVGLGEPQSRFLEETLYKFSKRMNGQILKVVLTSHLALRIWMIKVPNISDQEFM